MSDPKIICYFAEELTVGDICNLFSENTNAYEYVIDVDLHGALVLREPSR